MIGAATTTSANGQPSQPFIITYTDGTTTTVDISLSSWKNFLDFPGGTPLLATDYFDTGTGGRTSGFVTLSGYTIPLNSAKTVQSITLPNNRDVVIVAMSLSTSSTPTTVPGTYTYTPPAGTVPAAGTIPLNVVFTPTNTNFGTAMDSVNLVVNKAA